MHTRIRQQIVEVLKAHPALMTLAARQRAKFEGWLKFELAARIAAEGAESVAVESGYEGTAGRADLRFVVPPDTFFLELKTPNTNWRMSGVENKHRPITKNIASIISDAKKLTSCPGMGLMAFVLFPVRAGDNRWTEYLLRISEQVGIRLSDEEHCSRVKLELGPGQCCEAIVCCFPVRSLAKGQPA